MSERQTILNILKTQGEMTAAATAAEAGLTSMGARGHLERLEKSNLVGFHEVSNGRGRPKRFWSLTSLGHQQFPHQYDQLSVEIIDNVKEIFGQEGLDKLIEHREIKARQKYSAQLQDIGMTPSDKLQALATIRASEGYMAEVIATDKGWELLEHHCPICAAAKSCQNFCVSELAVFRDCLGAEFEVKRTEHLLSDGERCRYAITLVNKEL